jgi:NAD(P)-dependent dehydrogenase (short-subunit alcohol dehydrogenase family)
MPGPITTVLVLGAGAGLGLELVRHYLRRGAMVLATARARPPPEPLVRLAAHAGGRLLLAQVDVASDTSLQALAGRLRQKDGLRPVDLLINLTGVRQITTLDRLAPPAPPLPAHEALATLRVGYAVLDRLAERALVLCVSGPEGALEMGSLPLSGAPRISPAALLRALRTLAADLSGRQATLALLSCGHARPEHRLRIVTHAIDELRDRPLALALASTLSRPPEPVFMLRDRPPSP